MYALLWYSLSSSPLLHSAGCARRTAVATPAGGRGRAEQSLFGNMPCARLLGGELLQAPVRLLLFSDGWSFLPCYGMACSILTCSCKAFCAHRLPPNVHSLELVRAEHQWRVLFLFCFRLSLFCASISRTAAALFSRFGLCCRDVLRGCCSRFVRRGSPRRARAVVSTGFDRVLVRS
jgi:hypothetical protein